MSCAEFMAIFGKQYRLNNLKREVDSARKVKFPLIRQNTALVPHPKNFFRFFSQWPRYGEFPANDAPLRSGVLAQ